MNPNLHPVDISLDHTNSRRQHIPARVGYDTNLETYTLTFPDGYDPAPTVLGNATFAYPTINSLLGRLDKDGLHLSTNEPTPTQGLRAGLSETNILNLERRVQQHHGDIELIGLSNTTNPRLYLIGPSGTWAQLQPPIAGHQIRWGPGQTHVAQRLTAATMIADHLTQHAKPDNLAGQALELSHGWLSDIPPDSDFSATATSIATHLIATEHQPETQLEPHHLTTFRTVTSIDIPTPSAHSLQIR